jgi:protein SCO1
MKRRVFLIGSGALLLAEPVSAQITVPTEGSSARFTLTTTDGTVVTEQNFRGEWLVVYFGYTFCPDICPTTMMEIAGALKTLGPRADDVRGLFITIDPQRDTPSVLSEYLKSFDPRLVGLTGTATQIKAAARDFRVFYERNDNDDGGYTYDHSTFVYLIDPDGNFAKAIAGEVGSDKIADVLTALMNAAR